MNSIIFNPYRATVAMLDHGRFGPTWIFWGLVSFALGCVITITLARNEEEMFGGLFLSLLTSSFWPLSFLFIGFLSAASAVLGSLYGLGRVFLWLKTPRPKKRA